jgi:hypothetical protein
MKRSANPYTPGGGKRPSKLAGRDPDLENFGLLLERLGAGRHERDPDLREARLNALASYDPQDAAGRRPMGLVAYTS